MWYKLARVPEIHCPIKKINNNIGAVKFTTFPREVNGLLVFHSRWLFHPTYCGWILQNQLWNEAIHYHTKTRLIYVSPKDKTCRSCVTPLSGGNARGNRCCGLRHTSYREKTERQKTRTLSGPSVFFCDKSNRKRGLIHQVLRCGWEVRFKCWE